MPKVILCQLPADLDGLFDRGKCFGVFPDFVEDRCVSIKYLRECWSQDSRITHIGCVENLKSFSYGSECLNALPSGDLPCSKVV